MTTSDGVLFDVQYSLPQLQPWIGLQNIQHILLAMKRIDNECF